MRRIVLAATLLAIAGLLSFEAYRSRGVVVAEVSDGDVHRFVDAMRRLSAGDSSCAALEDYFRDASRGLRAYDSKLGMNRRQLCAAIRRVAGALLGNRGQVGRARLGGGAGRLDLRALSRDLSGGTPARRVLRGRRGDGRRHHDAYQRSGRSHRRRARRRPVAARVHRRARVRAHAAGLSVDRDLYRRPVLSARHPAPPIDHGRLGESHRGTGDGRAEPQRIRGGARGGAVGRFLTRDARQGLQPVALERRQSQARRPAGGSRILDRIQDHEIVLRSSRRQGARDPRYSDHPGFRSFSYG